MDKKLKYFFWNGLKIINSMIANGTIEETKLSAELQEKINSGGSGTDIQYSYTERKIGSYFGEDLYEKCIDIDETTGAGSYDVTIDLPGVDKVVDAVFYSAPDTDGAIFKSNYPMYVSNNISKGYIVKMFNYESEELPGAVGLVFNEFNTNYKGLLKVQYTKLATE